MQLADYHQGNSESGFGCFRINFFTSIISSHRGSQFSKLNEWKLQNFCQFRKHTWMLHIPLCYCYTIHIPLLHNWMLHIPLLHIQMLCVPLPHTWMLHSTCYKSVKCSTVQYSCTATASIQSIYSINFKSQPSKSNQLWSVAINAD